MAELTIPLSTAFISRSVLFGSKRGEMKNCANLELKISVGESNWKSGDCIAMLVNLCACPMHHGGSLSWYQNNSLLIHYIIHTMKRGEGTN